ANNLRVGNDLYQGLVTLDQNNNPIPGLADSWVVSNDGKTYTFHLRHGIKFSDGSPISANDFVYSWERLVNPKTGATYSYIANSILNANKIIDNKLAFNTLGVKASGDDKLIVTMEHPDIDFLAKLTQAAFSVVSQKNVEKYGNSWTDPANIVTSGAYLVKEYVINGHITIIKNPYYYNADKVKIAKVNFYPLFDTNTSVSKYKDGGLETTWTVPIDQFKSLKTTLGNQLHVTPTEGIIYYDINMLRPEFKDVRLRKALNLAVDRKVLTQDVLGTGVVPNYSNATDTIDNGAYKQVDYSWANEPRDEQIKEAQELYKQAGYSKLNPLKLTISYFTDDEQKKIALAIADMWISVLGAKVQIVNQEFKYFLQASLKGDYQIAAARWFADYNGVSTYLEYFKCNSSQNRVKLCDKEFDNYLDQALNSADPKLAHNYYLKALYTLQDQYSTIPLYQMVTKILVKPYVKGYNPNTNHLDLVYSEWFHY
ncbi:MAG: peptide ABC transporter substrate-binding protein, partial [Burkholderiales bacterium]|nr:peptide ABC transporter substrate-binding protein [Burkholderiales bacterium]